MSNVTPTLRNTVDDLANSNAIPAVLAFLAHARFLEGCAHGDDDRFEHGRQLILEWLEASYDYNPNVPEQLPEVQMQTLLYECAEVLYFVHSLEPLDPAGDDARAGRALCGYMEVLHWTERRIMRASGIGDARPHKTDAEKSEEREAVHRALEERRGTSVN